MKHIVQMALNRYKNDTQGQFGLVFAILAVPLLAASTLALDHAFAYKEKVKLGNALDDTALAAVLNQNLTDAEREKYAHNFFGQFFDSSKKIEFKVLEASNNRVSVTAEAKVPTSISNLFGKDHIITSEKAVRELTKGSVVCKLALDPEAPNSFEVAGGAVFNASTCSVQVNSTSLKAAIVHDGATASAQDFCISGNAVELHGANFEPFANTECSAISDPFKHTRIPSSGACIDQDALDKTLSHYLAEVYFEFDAWNPETQQLEKHPGGVDLKPGTYCGGLTLRNKNIRFEPGVYIIKDGPLNFDIGTQAFGKDVTFIFAGNGAVLNIDIGSKVDLSAPAKGDLKGLVFAEYVETRLGKDADFIPESIITSGGTLRLVGTAYMPSQKISFLGGSLSSAQAPATSFIARKILIDDGAKISVDVNHQKAGLPPILPRSDESARLVE